MNNNSRKKKGGIPPGVFVVGIIILCGLVNRLSNTDLALLFSVLIVIAFMVFVVKQAKKKLNKVNSSRPSAAPGSSVHSHDRLTGYVDNSCDGLKHWQQQLDGFLKEGLIDKEEYLTLLNKYKNSFRSVKK